MSVAPEHLAADRDHVPVHDPDDDTCLICGLATTSDGLRHGDDLSDDDEEAEDE